MSANETAMKASNPSRLTTKTLLRMLLGAILGAVVGYACMSLAMKLGVPSRSLTWSDFLAIWMGIVFVAMGVVFGYLATNRRQLARALEPPCAETAEAVPATDEEARTAQLQAAVLALAGVMLLAPILALGPMRSHPGIAVAVYTGIIILFAVQTLLNVQLWRKSDEFVKRALFTVSAITFAIGQGLLFLWAAAERLHLVAAVSGWDVYTLLMTGYLLVNSWVSIRLRR